MSLSKFTKECRIAMKWRIKEDFLKESFTEMENNVYKCVQSKCFNASTFPGVKYYLYFTLDAEDSNKVKIFLYLNFNILTKITCDCTISVKSATYLRPLKDLICDKSIGWGGYIFTRDEVFNPEKKFFVNGIMEIELEGTLKTDGGLKRKATEPLSLAKTLWESDDKDITIVVKDEQIKVHKWIICGNSPVFTAEMESGMKEAMENKIVITDFCFDTVETAVKYLYEHDIKDLVNEKNASELLHFSDKYDIKPLHDLIQTLLIEKLSETNVCKFANMSITSNAKDLRECCISFLMKLNGQSDIIEDFGDLKSEITNEIGRRFLFSTTVSK